LFKKIDCVMIRVPHVEEEAAYVMVVLYRASQKWSFHPERLASEPLGRGRCWRWAQPTASTSLSL